MKWEINQIIGKHLVLGVVELVSTENRIGLTLVRFHLFQVPIHNLENLPLAPAPNPFLVGSEKNSAKKELAPQWIQQQNEQARKAVPMERNA